MWHKVSETVPNNDREVFAWAKGCGIFYTARWSNEGYGFNLPWAVTHWMERPTLPE